MYKLEKKSISDLYLYGDWVLEASCIHESKSFHRQSHPSSSSKGLFYDGLETDFCNQEG